MNTLNRILSRRLLIWRVWGNKKICFTDGEDPKSRAATNQVESEKSELSSGESETPDAPGAPAAGDGHGDCKGRSTFCWSRDQEGLPARERPGSSTSSLHPRASEGSGLHLPHCPQEDACGDIR